MKKDGTLRDDIEVPEIEKQPESWDDIKAGIRATLHPEVEAQRNNQLQQEIRQRVGEINADIKSQEFNKQETSQKD